MTKHIIFDRKKILFIYCNTVQNKNAILGIKISFFCLISFLQANTAHLSNSFSNFRSYKERNFGSRKNLIIVSDVIVLFPVSLPVQFCTPLEVKFSIRKLKENRYGTFLIVFISENHDVSKEKPAVYT